MIHLAIILGIGVALLILVRRGLVHVDMSFPWLVGLVVLGLLSTREKFVAWVAAELGILYPPIAIVFLTLFLVFGLITVLLIAYTRLRHRQIQIVRYMAAQELRQQENALNRDTNATR